MTARQRILVLRTDRIGDAVIFSGALARLRAHWPEALLDLMVAPEVRPLFARCPHFDHLYSTCRLLPWDCLRRFVLRGSWALERVLLQERMRRLWYPRYDVVIYAVSAAIEPYLRAVRLMDAPEKWGYAGDQLRLCDLEDDANRPERVFTRVYRNRAEDRWIHEQERTRRFLAAMGVPPGALTPALWLGRVDLWFARRALPKTNALGFFLGAGSPLRQWPTAKWIELGRRQSASTRIVLLGGRAERALGTVVGEGLRAAGVTVLDLVGRTRLGELAACIQRCRVVVSNDSSGLHLAVAAGVPAVGLMGGYHFGRFYPWGDARIHRVANLPMDCYYCNDACKFGDWRCVSGIPVDRVLAELDIAVKASADAGVEE